jgi:hypothetical protein
MRIFDLQADRPGVISTRPALTKINLIRRLTMASSTLANSPAQPEFTGELIPELVRTVEKVQDPNPLTVALSNFPDVNTYRTYYAGE